MKKIFSEKEVTLISDVTHIALGNAGSSVAKMVRDEFLIKDVEIASETPESQFRLKDNYEKYHVLYTEVVGDLLAATYLLISPEVENILCGVLLPDSMLGRAEMREAALLEIDNIVIAAMVTKFSEVLGQNIHGDVPSSQVCTRDELEAIVNQKHLEIDTSLSFRGRITTFYKGICIEFVCLFDETVVEAIKSFDFDKKRQLKSKLATADVVKQEEEPEAKGVAAFLKKIFN
ncbi:MAG: hypothetical protein CMO01_03160 [Thalassobius sp.]|nr:hypothetical protein [Thalassovita sp.]